MNKHVFVDLHVLQTVPPSCVNRDDTGSPKTAIYGGVERARVSSQAWKRAMREYFEKHGVFHKDEIGFRSKRVPEIIAEEVVRISPDIDFEKALAKAKKVFTTYLGIKLDKEKKDRSATLLFISNAQLIALATLIAEGTEEKEAYKKALNDNPAIDICLFGRMVANESNLSLNYDAAVQVAHAISTHVVHTEYDYFTAMDERVPKEETGGAFLDTMEFNSSTLYRYATVNINELQKNLGKEDMLRAVCGFTDAFINSMPTGKQNSYGNHTNVDLVYVTVRTDQPVNLSGAFETPVENVKGGFAKKSCEVLLDYAENTYKTFIDKPELSLGSCNLISMEGHAEVMHTRKLLECLESYLADVCGKEEA